MSLSPQDLDYEEAHVHDNHAYQLIVPLAIFGFIAFSCVILRPVARHLSGTFLWLDDWLIIASMVRASWDVKEVAEIDSDIFAVLRNWTCYYSMPQ